MAEWPGRISHGGGHGEGHPPPTPPPPPPRSPPYYNFFRKFIFSKFGGLQAYSGQLILSNELLHRDFLTAF